MKIKVNSLVWYQGKPVDAGKEIDVDDSHVDFFVKRGDEVLKLNPPEYETKVLIPKKKDRKK